MGQTHWCFFWLFARWPCWYFFWHPDWQFFDRGLASHFANPHLLYHQEKREVVQKMFFQATFSVLGYLAKVDGRVSEQEIKMAELLMAEMGLSKEQKKLAKYLFNEGKNPAFKLESALVHLRKVCHDNRELLKLFIDIQYRAAMIDGLSQPKIKALDLIFSYLGFAPLHQQYRFYEDFTGTSSHHHSKQERSSSSSSQQRQSAYQPPPPPNSLAQAYALLECSESATRQEVKKAYRRLLSRNHPDKLIAQGLPEEMIKIANNKTHQIMKAYELICQTKGW